MASKGLTDERFTSVATESAFQAQRHLGLLSASSQMGFNI